MRETERFRRRDLPHWDVPGATDFVTSCLEGSIPAQGLLDIASFEKTLRQRSRPIGMKPADGATHSWKQGFARIDFWLDRQPAVPHLEQPKLAKIVRDSLLHFDGQRYDLLSYVVMPRYFHWVFKPRDEWVNSLKGEQSPRQRIMQSVKRYTALECNHARHVPGTFWQEESYDHWVRDADELDRIIHDVEDNPVKAGLVSRPELWPFSSAHGRRGGRFFHLPVQ